jgi:hypothetical protein
LVREYEPGSKPWRQAIKESKEFKGFKESERGTAGDGEFFGVRTKSRWSISQVRREVRCLSVLKARFDIIHRQPRVVGEQLVKIRFVGQIFKDHFHRDARFLGHRFANQNYRILDDAINVRWLLFGHADLTSFQ